jgi:small subunit ribosomal protein S20
VERELRTAARKQERNKAVRSLSKTAVKRAEKAVAAGESEPAKEAVATAISTLDRTAEKKILHRNNVARRKARLMKKLNKAGTAPAESKTK